MRNVLWQRILEQAVRLKIILISSLALLLASATIWFYRNDNKILLNWDKDLSLAVHEKYEKICIGFQLTPHFSRFHKGVPREMDLILNLDKDLLRDWYVDDVTLRNYLAVQEDDKKKLSRYDDYLYFIRVDDPFKVYECEIWLKARFPSSQLILRDDSFRQFAKRKSLEDIKSKVKIFLVERKNASH